MNLIELKPIISSGAYPRMVCELGLTWTRTPWLSVTRIRSCEVSKMRWRSSISWLSAAGVFLASVRSWTVVCAPIICADGLGDATDRARARPDRGDAERNRHCGSVAAQSHGFMILDSLAAADLTQDIAQLGLPFGRNDELDTLADRF